MTSAPGALRAACRSRRITLLDRIPTSYDTDVTLIHQDQVIKVGNLGGQGPEANHGRGCPRRASETRLIDSLMVGVNGQIAGLIDFRPSSRLAAATALQELRGKTQYPLAIGLISETAEPRVRHLATRLGVDFHHGEFPPTTWSSSFAVAESAGSRSHTPASACSATGPPEKPTWPSHSTRTASKTWIATPRESSCFSPTSPGSACSTKSRGSIASRVLVAQGSAWIPNLFCVAGAFFLGFSSLTTVAITNLGTYSTYARTSAAIRGLEKQLARVSRRRVSRIAG